MKIPDVEPSTKDPELLDYLDFTSLILNGGRYEMRIVGSPPTWIANEGECVLYSAGNERALYCYINGQWVYVAWGGGATTINAIFDADNDTKIQVEESDDEDIIRFDVGGTEQIILQDGALLPTTDDDIDLGSSTARFKDSYMSGKAHFNDATTYIRYNTGTAYFELYVNNALRVQF